MATRWGKSTDAPVHRSADRVLRLFDWKFRQKFVRTVDEHGESHGYLQKNLEVLDGMGGILQDDEMRRAVRTDGAAQLDETAVRPGSAARSQTSQRCQGSHARSRSRAVGTVSAEIERAHFRISRHQGRGRRSAKTGPRRNACDEVATRQLAAVAMVGVGRRGVRRPEQT